MLESNKKVWFLIALFSLLLLLLVLAWVILFYPGEKTQLQEKSLPAPTGEKKPAAALSEIMPTGSKEPEEFMAEVQEKAAEMQKNYDSSLAEFAAKKWARLFGETNQVNQDYLAKSIKILSQNVEKTTDQSTLFKIKYRVDNGGNGVEAEDYFYLVLSEPKKSELGLADLKTNTFLSEEDIKNNLAREGFAKITKIQK